MQAINLVFHNQGLRSYIEVDLCAQCPRQDDKGCCGNYSPEFFCSDLAWLLLHDRSVVDEIFAMERLTVLDYSVTVNQLVDGASYWCRFHRKEGGCRLPQHLRESICRHFVCVGIGWQQEPELSPWKQFFEQLGDYEIALNQQLADTLSASGLNLRRSEQRDEIFARLPGLYQDATALSPEFFTMVPAEQHFTLYRELSYRENWIL